MMPVVDLVDPSSLARARRWVDDGCVSDEDLPDARDGLTRKERIVLWMLSSVQAERDGWAKIAMASRT